MTKRRPSIKGRGAEILFGEPPPPVAPLETGDEPFAGTAAGQPPAASLYDVAAESFQAEGEDLLPEGDSMADLLIPEGEGMAAPPAEGEPLEALPLPAEAAAAQPIQPSMGEPVGDEESPLSDFEPGPHEPEMVAIPQPEAPGPGGLPGEPDLMPDAENLPDLEAIASDELRDLHDSTSSGDAAAVEIPAAGAPAEGPAPVDSTAAAGAGGPLVEGLVEPRPAVDVGAGVTVLETPTAPADDSDEVEKALREEALNGLPLVPPSLEGHDVGDETPDYPPVTPEMEAAFISEAGAAEEPPEPVAELPSPTLEATMDEHDITTTTAIHQPPPPENLGDGTGGVEPPRGVTPVFTLPEGAPSTTADIQEGTGVKPEEVHPDLTPEQQQAVLKQIGIAQLRKLDREITASYEDVIDIVGDNPDVTNECYNLLLKARDLMWRRDAGGIAQAESFLQQAKARLRRAKDSQAGARRYQWRIGFWGIGWVVVFLLLLYFGSRSAFGSLLMPAPTEGSVLDMTVFVPALLWGGIGGATAVLYSLFKHVGERDFDTAFNLSYVGKPFLGAALGAAVYMAFMLLMRVLSIVPAGTASSPANPSQAPFIIYLFAWAGGFKENRVLDLVDRVMKQIFSSGEGSTPPPATTATTTVIVPEDEGTTPT